MKKIQVFSSLGDAVSTVADQIEKEADGQQLISCAAIKEFSDPLKKLLEKQNRERKGVRRKVKKLRAEFEILFLFI